MATKVSSISRVRIVALLSQQAKAIPRHYSICLCYDVNGTRDFVQARGSESYRPR